MKTIDWAAVRAQFPALETTTYLNTATYGQTPRAAVAGINAHMAHRDRYACADFLSWFDDMDELRAEIGRLVGCQGEDIAFLHTASTALSLLIAGIDWQQGDRVVTLTNEFPNNLYYPALLAGRGVEFIETPWECFRDAIAHPRTRLVAISSVSYMTGFRAPLQDIARELDRRGILFYVDGTQSVGALKMNVGDFEPAMMAVDPYKWMLTPNGGGFAYVNPRVRKWLPPAVIGWRSHFDWRSVDSLHGGAPEFSEAAEKYEGGMLAFPVLYALREVVRMMLDLGPEAIEQRVMELSNELRARLRAIGAQVQHEGAPVVAARFPSSFPEASLLARQLRERNVLVAARHGNLRISPHFYNDVSDLERFETEVGALATSPRP
jgi:selenocysteine lyase/cysteine desulfurase